MKLSLRQRLAKHSTTDPATGCIHCSLSVTANGYSHIGVRGQMILSHRLAWMLDNGPIPENVKGKPAVIEHRCSNKTCINTAHLRLTTQQANVNHPVTKARKQAATKRRGKNLTEHQLAEIHLMIDNGMTGYAIAQKTGRSESHISVIRRRYQQRKKQNDATALLKDINKRLAVLLDLRRKRKPVAPTEGGQSLAA